MGLGEGLGVGVGNGSGDAKDTMLDLEQRDPEDINDHLKVCISI